jgi:hypothetical protein
MRLFVSLALLLACPAVMFAEPPFWQAAYEGFADPEPPAPLPRDKQAVLRPLTTGFLNPSMEGSLDGAALPNWTREGTPAVRGDRPAADGAQFGWVGGTSHRFRQLLALDQPAWETVCIGAQVLSEQGGELPAALLSMDGPNGAFVFERVTGSGLRPGVWSPFFAAVTRQPALDRLAFFTTSRQDIAWLGWDDLRVLREGTADGDFEADGEGPVEWGSWGLAGSAGIETAEALAGGRSVALPPGGAAVRRVAHAPGGPGYFIAARATGALRVREERFSPGGSMVAVEVTASPDADGRVVADLPPTAGAHAARLVIEAAGAETVLLDDVARGWAGAWPPVIEPAAGSLRETVRLTAVWPGWLESARIEVLDAGGAVVTHFENEALERDRTSAWVEWRPAGVAAGVYTARFTLQGQGDARVAVERSFEVVAGDPYPAVPEPLTFDRFEAVPWIWLFYNFEDERPRGDLGYRAVFEKARAMGFTRLWVSHLEEQAPMLRTQLEAVGLPYIVASPPLLDTVFQQSALQPWTPQTFLDRMTLVEAFRGSPLYSGLYIVDEPAEGIWQRGLHLAVRFERLPGIPPGYSFHNGARDPITGRDFPVIASFVYPYRRQPERVEDRLRAALAVWERNHAHAVAVGREHWTGVQGFSSTGANASVPTAAEVSAQLGLSLAAGARGYFVFTFTSVGRGLGMLDHAFEPVPMAAAFAAFNARATAVSPFLFAASRDRVAPPQEGPVVARAMAGHDGFVYTFLVNLDVTQRRESVMEFDEATALADVEGLEVWDEDMRHRVALEPGGWRLLRSAGWPVRVTTAAAGAAPVVRAGMVLEDVITAPAAVTSLAISPDGAVVAAVAGGRHRAWQLEPAGGRGTELLAGTLPAAGGVVRFAGDGRLVGSGRGFGAAVYTRGGDGRMTLTTRLQRQTGGAADALPLGDGLLLARHYFGLAMADPGASFDADYTIGARVPSPENEFTRLWGPFDGGAVLALEAVRGLYRATVEGGTITLERQTGRNAHHGGALSARRDRLALARGDRGVAVLALDEAGRVTAAEDLLDPELVEAFDVAWTAGDSLLAVADLRRGVVLYRQSATGGWVRAGQWGLDSETLRIESLAGGDDGRLLAGLSDGRILLLRAGLVGTGWVAE